MDKRPTVVLDIGAGYLSGIMAIGEEEPKFQDWHVMEHPNGFSNGFVTNLEQAMRSLDSLLQKLFHGGESELPKLKARTTFYVVLGNSKLKTFTYASSIYFQGARRNIQPHDVRAVMEQTRSVATLPLSEHILHSYPVSFLVNDIDGVVDPVGLEASRLGVVLKMLTMNYDDFKNIQKAFDLTEIEVKSFYPKLLTGSLAILTEQEKDEGAVLIDVDEYAIFCTLWKKKELIDSWVIESGDKGLTRKIAQTYRIDDRSAAKVKERYGSLNSDLDFADELIPLIFKNEEEKCPIRRQEFHQKFLELSKEWLEDLTRSISDFTSKHHCFDPHYVFIGRGTSTDHFLEFMRDRFGINGRIGAARNFEVPQEILLNQALIPGLGLLSWLQNQNQKEWSGLATQPGLLQKTVSGAIDWFSNYF